MIRIRCRCGEVFHAEEQHVGRVLHCRCGREIPVRMPPPRPEPPAAPRSAAWEGRLRRLGERASAGLAGAFRAPAGPLGWLVWAAWGYLAAVVLLWAVLWTLGDRWWPATVYLFGPRWVVLLPLVLLVPAAAVFRRALLLPLLAAALVMVFPVMGMRTGWRSWGAAEPTGQTLRVVSANLAGDPWAAERLIGLVGEWRADVVAAQECSEKVAEAFGRVPGWEHRRDGQLCLFSRHPVRAVEVMDRSRFEGVREAGIGGTSAAARYTIEVAGRPVELVNVHLETPRRGLSGLFRNDAGRMGPNTLSRQIESNQVARWAAQRGAQIVAGDFNMPVESRIYRESWGGYRNAFSHAGRGLGFTRDNGWIRVRIDHVLAGPGWRVDLAFVGPDVGSDHWPVVADLTWTGGR
ncbi:MAG TPA: endonuclease/exonuclease/phosphatase family protein [Longimicrobiaceae bacterium]|nr:endonuclease/exonuclease/phosphatase family protein [Longimicrobiaceae bacterium]